MRKLACLALFLAIAVGASAQFSVVVQNLTLEGAEAVPEKEREQIVREVRARHYRTDQLDDIAAMVRLAFQDLGYFKVRVDDPKVREVGPYHPRQKVDVVAHVVPGVQYSVKSISFHGNQVVPSVELRRQFRIRDGDIFSRGAIGRGLEDIRKLYGEHGYINFTSVPNTEVDETRKTILLNVDCDEGQQFRFGELILDGIEPYAGAGKQVLAEWQSYRGKVYDARAVETFLARHKKLFGEQPRFDTRGPHDGSMNLVVHFDQSVARN